MNKPQIIDEIRKKIQNDKYGASKRQIAKVLDAFCQVTQEALLEGDGIMLKGFLNIHPSNIREREGYNPIAGVRQVYPPKKTVRCNIGKPITKRLNQTNEEEVIQTQ